MFEDIGFDLLPKNSVPVNTPITIQPIDPSQINSPEVLHAAGATPDPIPSKKGSSTLGWFLFGLFVVGSIGMTIYGAKKDTTYKKRA